MAKPQNYVDWDATLHIWWALVWRYGAATLLQYIFDRITKDISGIFLIDFVFDCWVWQWALRAALMNKYNAFFLIAEKKKTGVSIYNANGRVSWYVALRVWWTLSWRIYLIPFLLQTFIVIGMLMSGKDLGDIFKAMDASWLEYTSDFIMLAVSPWAVRESLADRYRSFRFVTKLKGESHAV